jgi:hypothetical protein
LRIIQRGTLMSLTKQAIKVLEKRIELLNNEYDKQEQKFNYYEMACDYEFLINDLANIELEIIELQNAIKILNDNYLKQ